MHTPVLLKEILEIFDPKPGQTYIDATVNGGGHARAIAQRIGEKGRILGIDWDCELIGRIKRQKSGIKNIEFICGNYRDIKKIATENNFEKPAGILFDLGFSSYQIESSGRGFSFRRDEPLDMRYDISENRPTAEEIVNHWSRERIEKILREYSEERFSRKIAWRIESERKIKKISSSAELARIIEWSIPRKFWPRAIHPATRTFQALRIAVNSEFENIEMGLAAAAKLLAVKGTLVVISFHSLEDKLVKKIFKESSGSADYQIITPKPVKSSPAEIQQNPRARSALLRAIMKI